MTRPNVEAEIVRWLVSTPAGDEAIFDTRYEAYAFVLKKLDDDLPRTVVETR